MPTVKLSVELSFGQGQKTVISAEIPGSPPSPAQEEHGVPAYTLGDATGPQEPTLISSSNFVELS